jgi:hypothetical protein
LLVIIKLHIHVTYMQAFLFYHFWNT